LATVARADDQRHRHAARVARNTRGISKARQPPGNGNSPP
jgi:hypothetical protein